MKYPQKKKKKELQRHNWRVKSIKYPQDKNK